MGAGRAWDAVVSLAPSGENGCIVPAKRQGTEGKGAGSGVLSQLDRHLDILTLFALRARMFYERYHEDKVRVSDLQ